MKEKERIITGNLPGLHISAWSNIPFRGIKMRIKNEWKDWRNVIVLPGFSIWFPGGENPNYIPPRRSPPSVSPSRKLRIPNIIIPYYIKNVCVSTSLAYFKWCSL